MAARPKKTETVVAGSVAPIPPAQSVQSQQREVWISFTEAKPPTKERFAYCRKHEGGCLVVALAEVSESLDGLGLFVDGVAGFQLMPEGDGHWWRLLDLPS